VYTAPQDVVEAEGALSRGREFAAGVAVGAAAALAGALVGACISRRGIR
jgi:hypothetical protein